MPVLDWVYYDHVDVGTAAATEKGFFSHEEAGDGIAATNLGSANELPTNESFEVQEIHIFATPDIAVNDVYELFEEAMIEIKINNNRKIIFPAILAGSNCHQYLCWENVNTAAAASTASPTGGPFVLQMPIIIPGGVKFEVIFKTGTSAASAGDALCIALRGKLTRTYGV